MSISNLESNSEIKKKLTIVGDEDCGKTSLLFVQTKNVFPGDFQPTAFHDYTSSITVDNQIVKITCYDTRAQEEFDKIRPLAYSDSDIVIIAFGIDDPNSLENVTAKWIVEVTHFCPSIPIVLVGCKKDLRTDSKTTEELAQNGLQLVSTDQGREIANQIGAISYLECSAKTGEGVTEVFEESARGILQSKRIRSNTKGCLVL